MSIFHQGYDNMKEILEVKCLYSIRDMKRFSHLILSFNHAMHDKVSTELVKF